ncbi:hypothetical protein B484DRAFT_451386 [Ochromonadaceae sp. CCMP2298]|nr:hypothetical protein B484DRAFT_451386 [Ochromonadaceae sp. CCMP2298]
MPTPLTPFLYTPAFIFCLSLLPCVPVSLCPCVPASLRPCVPASPYAGEDEGGAPRKRAEGEGGAYARAGPVCQGPSEDSCDSLIKPATPCTYCTLFLLIKPILYKKNYYLFTRTVHFVGQLQ